ncbi:hypothetical protein ACU4GR_01650 [Methylobacterium oryzae CBMB20]
MLDRRQGGGVVLTGLLTGPSLPFLPPDSAVIPTPGAVRPTWPSRPRSCPPCRVT